jgi:hypothetical protein
VTSQAAVIAVMGAMTLVALIPFALRGRGRHRRHRPDQRNDRPAAPPGDLRRPGLLRDPDLPADRFEPIYLTERWGSAAFDGVPLIAGLVLIALGAIAVAKTRAVSALVTG